jgi:hypothetical protein
LPTEQNQKNDSRQKKLLPVNVAPLSTVATKKESKNKFRNSQQNALQKRKKRKIKLKKKYSFPYIKYILDSILPNFLRKACFEYFTLDVVSIDINKSRLWNASNTKILNYFFLDGNYNFLYSKL